MEGFGSLVLLAGHDADAAAGSGDPPPPPRQPLMSPSGRAQRALDWAPVAVAAEEDAHRGRGAQAQAPPP
eukprot:41503-Chlamydomonas_euryale.AAC.1